MDQAPTKRTSALSVTSIILSKRNYSFLKGNMFWFKFIFGLKLFNRFDFYLKGLGHGISGNYIYFR